MNWRRVRALVASHALAPIDEEAKPAAAGGTRPPAVVPLVPKRYAAGLENRCPGGALFQTGYYNSQQLGISNARTNGIASSGPALTPPE